MLPIQDPSRLKDVGKSPMFSHGMLGFGFEGYLIGDFQLLGMFYCVKRNSSHEVRKLDIEHNCLSHVFIEL